MAEELQAEGDDMFIGFASRLDPANLKPGMLQASFNTRLQRGIAQPRKGTKRLTDNDLINLTMVGSGLYVDDAGHDNIVLVFTDRMYLYKPAQGSNPEDLSQAFLFPANRTIAVGGICDVVTALNKVYIFRGKYDKTTFAASASNPSIATGNEGTITITTVGNHGYSNNDEVTIGRTVGSDGPGQAVTNSYVITVTGPTTFTFQYTNNTASTYIAQTGQSGWTARRGKPPLIWEDGQATLSFAQQKFTIDGTTVTGITESVPCADFGLYFQNRLILKYGDYQMLVSDILSEQCDTTLNNFIINTGGNDSIVGVLPWVQDQFLVFMTKSIYVVYVETDNFATDSPPGAQSSTTVVTTEIGCLARRSIVSAGQFVFFLSTNGVHMLTPQLDLKLLGNTLPLSEPIADFFDAVNYDTVQNSVATYYNNRFYIAMPIGSATRNNKILVYNTLNQAWESIDYYPTGLFQDNLILSAYINQRRLMIITNFAGEAQYGGVFLSEEQVQGDEFNVANATPVLPFDLFPASVEPDGTPVKTESTLIPSTQNFVHISASIKTREYTFGGTSEKRYSRGEFSFNNVQNDFVQIDTTTYDPDTTETVLEYSFSGNSDGTLRPRIAARGTSIACTVNFVVGRPSLKSTAVYAIAANRPMISQE
jgi:predicted RNA-binding protein with TRAM domain